MNVQDRFCLRIDVITSPLTWVILSCRNEALRVAFIDEVETLKDGKVNKEYISKLVKADINGKDKVSFFFCSKICLRRPCHFHYTCSIYSLI